MSKPVLASVASQTQSSAHVFQTPAVLGRQIAYLGKKTKLLPAIFAAVDAAAQEDPAFAARRAAGEWTFLDAFAGSVSVARAARALGAVAISNDLEDYALTIGQAALETPADPAQWDRCFETAAFAQLCASVAPGEPPTRERALAALNAMTAPSDPKKAYFSRHYAPKTFESPDFETERLFYTPANALRFDAWMEALEGDAFRQPENRVGRALLCADIFCELVKRSNTSGVMKGFHHGWGGKGSDALGRIVSPAQLEGFEPPQGPVGHALRGDAAQAAAVACDWLAKRSTSSSGDSLRPFETLTASSSPLKDGFSFASRPPLDVVYADPPYNQHQYGANYHLLTSFERADRLDPGPVERGTRAGIRRDHQKSDYCKKRDAAHAFEQFVQSLHGRACWLLVSYNNEGFISPEEMVAILGEGGANTLRVRVVRHDKFKGGKAVQSSTKTAEFIVSVRLGWPQPLEEQQRVSLLLQEGVQAVEAVDVLLDPNHPALAQVFDVQIHRSQWWLLDPHTKKKMGAIASSLRGQLCGEPLNAAQQQAMKKAEISREKAPWVLMGLGRLSHAARALLYLKITKHRALFAQGFDELQRKARDAGELQAIEPQLERLRARLHSAREKEEGR